MPHSTSPNSFQEAEARLSNHFCPKVKQRPAVYLRPRNESVAFNWILTVDIYFPWLNTRMCFIPFLWFWIYLHVFCLSRVPFPFSFICLHSPVSPRTPFQPLHIFLVTWVCSFGFNGGVQTEICVAFLVLWFMKILMLQDRERIKNHGLLVMGEAAS